MGRTMIFKTILGFFLCAIILICVVVGFVLYLWPILKGILIRIFNFIRGLIMKILGMKHTHGPFHHIHSHEKSDDKDKSEGRSANGDEGKEQETGSEGAEQSEFIDSQRGYERRRRIAGYD